MSQLVLEVLDKPITQRLIYSMEQTQELLGGVSRAIIALLEEEETLTPIRLTGRKHGQVFYAHDELMSLLKEREAEAKGQVTRRPLKKAAA